MMDGSLRENPNQPATEAKFDMVRVAQLPELGRQKRDRN